MEITWFRRPGVGEPGTLNLGYHALDRHVVGGRAGDPALIDPQGSALDFAALLGLVSGLGGALAALGVERGSVVLLDLSDRGDALVAALACTRLGAVPALAPEGPLAAASDAYRPHAVATSRRPEFGRHQPAVCLVRGVAPVDDRRDIDWEVALRAGRTTGSAAEPLAPDAPAYLLPSGPVSVHDVLTAEAADPLGTPLRRLAAGEPVDLSAPSR